MYFNIEIKYKKGCRKNKKNYNKIKDKKCVKKIVLKVQVTQRRIQHKKEKLCKIRTEANFLLSKKFKKPIQFS